MNTETIEWKDVYKFFHHQMSYLSWRLDWIKDRFVNECPFGAFEELNKTRDAFKNFLEKDSEKVQMEFELSKQMWHESHAFEEVDAEFEFQLPASEK